MDAQRIDKICDNVRYLLVDSIPSDAANDEVLQILEHLQEMTDMWISYIREKMSEA